MKWQIGMAACVWLATATGGPAAVASPDAKSGLTGEWSGSWHREKPVAGGGELHLSIGDKTTLKRVGTACPPAETPATVTVTGDDVKIEIVSDKLKGTFVGKRAGKDITGTMTVSCSAGTGTGTWKLSSS